MGVTLFSLFASAEEGLIPSWIKTTAGFWANEQVSDREFISALQIHDNKWNHSDAYSRRFKRQGTTR